MRRTAERDGIITREAACYTSTERFCPNVASTAVSEIWPGIRTPTTKELNFLVQDGPRGEAGAKPVDSQAAIEDGLC